MHESREGIARNKAEDADREAGDAKRQQGIAQTAAQQAKDTATDLASQLRETRRLHDLSKLREAQTAFDNNLIQLARDTLADILPENRCLVWGLLNRRFEGSLFTLRGHSAAVESVTVSPDGSWIVTGSADHTARVWDARTGQPLLELTGHTGVIYSVAVSANGSRIVTGSADGTARVWDAKSARTLLELKGHTALVISVAVSADGSHES